MTVFYTPKMVAAQSSFSPSPAKPALVVESWKKLGLPLEIVEPAPLSRETIALAHDPNFVHGVLDLRFRNGFENCNADVAASLPYTSGAMLDAARHALSQRTFTAAPCSGFHHANYHYPRAFCTFNGLMITALALKESGLIRTIGILDCDVHYGDGTDEIIEHTNSRSWIHHITSVRGYRCEAESFLANLGGYVQQMAECDLLLYQAGADMHIDDPLGGFLTTEQLALRDRIVFTTARKLGLPVAWNLAGGYQERFESVLEVHDNTFKACVEALRAAAG